VLDELDRNLTDPIARVRADGSTYVRKLAGKALGPERARKLFAPVNPPEPSTLDLLRSARVNALADMLAEEHPQISAVVLTQLPPRLAAKVLGMMPGELAADLIARTSSIDEVPEHAVAEASETLVKALAAAGGLASSDRRAEFDGLSFAASIVNEMNAEVGDELLAKIDDQRVASRIREAMFTFEDLLRIPVRELGPLLRAVQTDTLVIALQTATPELREHLLGGLSQRAAATLRDDLAAASPKRISDVETAQREIIEAAMQLSSDGKLTLPARGGADA
jgi:flagellar motor switch protein FliG